MLKYTVIKESDWKVSNWSGGTTSELFIFPTNMDFKQNDFELRLSIATVEVEESNFTSLPDVFRTLTVLSGNLELNHLNHHSALLKEYEQDSFLGEWKTTSRGKVTDFNVMTRGRTRATVQHLSTKNAKENLFITTNQIIFVAEGLITIDGEIHAKNTLIVNNGNENISYTLQNKTHVLIISTSVITTDQTT